MPRVSQETMEKLNDFLNSLPAEARSKCALCNETLTHIVKRAEAETGAPTATVTKALANRVNDGAAPGDVVSGKKLQDKVRYHSGADKVGNSEDKPIPKSKECPICGSVYPGDNEHCPNKCEKAAAEKPEVLDARHFCFQAVGKLHSIPQDDTSKVPELLRVLDYIIEQIHDSGDSDALANCASKFKSYIDHEKPPGLPNCRGRMLSTEERDDILLQAEKLYPGKNDGWKRACALNEAGLKCGRGNKASIWTPKVFRDNLRHAKNRQAAK